MINEISNILKIIRSGNIDKAFQQAKTLYLKNENNLDVVKLLAYTYIQIGNFERVVEVLQKAYKNKDDQKTSIIIIIWPIQCPNLRIMSSQYNMLKKQ